GLPYQASQNPVFQRGELNAPLSHGACVGPCVDGVLVLNLLQGASDCRHRTIRSENQTVSRVRSNKAIRTAVDRSRAGVKPDKARNGPGAAHCPPEGVAPAPEVVILRSNRDLDRTASLYLNGT